MKDGDSGYNRNCPEPRRRRHHLQKFILFSILIILMALAACSDPAPTPDPTETPTPSPIAATPALIPNTPEPEPTATTVPATTETPTPVPPETPSSLPPTDQETVLSSLSEDELACIGQDPERMISALTGGSPSSKEQQTRVIRCLDDDTLDLLFMATIIPVPLSEETSTCVLAALEVIDPRAVMTAGPEGDPQKAMTGSMAAFSVSVACLNDEEWTAAVPRLGMEPEDREGMVCVMAALGGPAEMATAMTEAMASEGVAEDTALFAAGLECGMGAPDGSATPQPATATPSPTPTATMEAPTPSLAPANTPYTPAATATTVPSTPAATPTTTLVITVAEVPVGIPEYSRSEWKHWTDEDGDCQDTRQEVLVAESLEPVTYEGDRQCRVEWGRWWAPYLSHHLENPRHLDVDHHVPLRNAHLSGGWAWDEERKEEYANYLGAENHLIAISARHNRSKGARGPEEWAPPDNSLWCQYSLDWAEIKQGWGLTMTPVESHIVMDMIGTCEDPPDFEMETRDVEVRVGENRPTAEPEGTVYGSCEEAAASGEERVQGSRGGGRGFPKAMVPSARDGDGDGVVCER